MAARHKTEVESDEAAVQRGVSGRPMRSDARLNYDRLVQAARDVFALDGGSASMEAIAKRAGVGVGTLYRHFPKRLDVVEAVYRDDVEALYAAAEKAAANLEPWPAVVAFLEAFVKYAQGKRTFITELQLAFEKNPELRSGAREQIDRAIDLVVGRAQRAGAMRSDVTGPEVAALLGPMCTSPTLTEEQGMRLLGMILDGLKARS